MTRFVGPSASSGYGLPTGVVGPAALWYHQALAVGMSSPGSHRAAPGLSCDHGVSAAALPMQQAEVLNSDNIRLDFSTIATCPT